MACFHIPSVTCENCAHLQKGSAKGPWVGVVTTGGTYFSSHDLTDAMQRLTLERDEARAERDALHLALRQVLDALGNGSGATEDASVEFLCHAPEEVRAVVADLRGELTTLRGSSASAIPELERSKAYDAAYTLAWESALYRGATPSEAHDIAQRKMRTWKGKDT